MLTVAGAKRESSAVKYEVEVAYDKVGWWRSMAWNEWSGMECEVEIEAAYKTRQFGGTEWNGM